MHIYNLHLVLAPVYSGKACACDNIKNDASGLPSLPDLTLPDWLSDWDLKNISDTDPQVILQHL